MRIPRPTSKPASVWPIHRRADAAEARLSRAFRAAIRAMRDSLDLADFARAYRGSNPEPLWYQPGWQRSRNTLYWAVAAALEAELRELAAYALRILPVRKQDVPARAEGAFNLVNPRAVEWARREAARLVVEVDAETRVAIRQLIVQMQRGQLTVDAAARQLRGVVGLTTQQAQAVYNFRRELERRAGLLDAAPKPLTPTQRAIVRRQRTETQAQVDRAVGRYEARQLRHRTENIAWTESMRAANRGEQEAWLAARDEGLLPDGQLQRWLVTPDERLCPICRPMEDQTTPIGQPFTHPETFEQIMGPPLHVSCRCSLALVVDEEFSSADRALAQEIQVTIR